MITNLGKQHIRSYLAGLSPSIGQSIALGVRSTTPTAGDTAMAFEVVRVPVTSVALDPTTDKIIFKGTVESANALNVHEVGLWSSSNDDDSMLVLGFDEFDEMWDGDVAGYVEDAPTSRIGTSLMNMTVTNATPKIASYRISEGDFTGMLGPDDRWSIAFNKVGTAAVNIKLILRSGGDEIIDPEDGEMDEEDLGNGRMEITFFPSNITAAGYTFGTAEVKDAVSYGAFDPADVTRFDLVVVPASGNSATTTIQLDGVVADNAPSEREESILVARALVSPAFTTDSATATDVEYEMSVTL